jgi:hypothetical protein
LGGELNVPVGSQMGYLRRREGGVKTKAEKTPARGVQGQGKDVK